MLVNFCSSEVCRLAMREYKILCSETMGEWGKACKSRRAVTVKIAAEDSNIAMVFERLKT